MTPAAIIVTVALYLAVLFVVAWVSARRADNATFFTAARRTPWWIAAVAMVSAAMSGVTFISVPGSVAADSFSYMQMVAGFTVGQLVVAFVLVPLFYRLRITSLYEYLDGRFGPSSHHTGAWFFLLSKLVATALKLYIVCAVMQLLVFDPYGLPLWLNVILTVGIVWLYTARGGVRTVIWSDVVKTVLMVASMALAVWYITKDIGLSLSELPQYVASAPESRVFFFDAPQSERYFWKMFVAGIVLLIAMTGLDQDMMQRNMSCPSPRDAQKNIVVAAVCQIAVIGLFLVLGVLLYGYAAMRELTLPEKSDQLFSMVAIDGGLPLSVGVLFVLGLISSTVSSAGSALTALTTSFTVDILGVTNREDELSICRTRHMVHAAMAAVVGVTIMAFGYGGDESVINLTFKVAGYTYGPILGMFAFGLLTRRRVRDRLVPAVVVAAPVLSVALQWCAREFWNHNIGFELLIYNAAFTFAGLYVTSLRNEK